MAKVIKPTGFKALPTEIQVKIYKEAITDEHRVKVVPVINSTKRVVLTRNLMRAPSKFFGLCPVATEVVKSIYDCPLLLLDRGIERVIRFSTKLDIFLISPWQYTLGINVNMSAFFHQSLDAIQPAALSKVEQVMEHQLDLEDLVYHPVPKFDRLAYPSARVCYIRVDHQRPSIATFAGQLPGPGPHTAADLLNRCTRPSWYEERTIVEEVDGEVDGEGAE